MKKLRLWVFVLLLASTLFLAIAQQGKADSDRPSVNMNGLVRLVYFLPSDRPARPDRAAALRQLIKDAQQFYADEMHRHGFGGKTFTLETNNNGEPLVHQINGKFREEYYYSENLTDYAVWEELLEHFDGADLQHIYFVAIDLSYEALGGGESGGLGSAIFYPAYGDIGFGPAGKAKLRHRDLTQGEEVLGGFALIPAHGHNFERLGLTLHELGHAFSIDHDFRKDQHSDYVMAFGKQNRLSKCAAEWLSVSRFFNTKSTFRNEPGEIQLLSLRTYGRDVIGFRFRVRDPNRLHQAQLLVPDILKDPRWAGWGPYRLFDCKRLNGTRSIVESVVRTAEIVDRVTLQIINVGGNITWATFPIELDEAVPASLDVNSDGSVNILDLAPLAPHFGQPGNDSTDVNEDGVVDIMDVLLVASISSSVPRQAAEMFDSADVQKWLTLAEQSEIESNILKKGIVNLESLLAIVTEVEVDIPDPNLRAAVESTLGVASGASIGSLEMATLTELRAPNANISDLTGLEFATNLTNLNLGAEHVEGRPINSNSVSDISPLTSLTNLTFLDLGSNTISNISPVAGLTNLTELNLWGNSISDISAVAGLINLIFLDLDGNAFSDISAVAGLTNLTFLDIWGTPISDISPVADLTKLTTLGLGHNNISDISPVAGLTNLTGLYLPRNHITDLSSLSNLTNLKTLWLNHNSISDLSPLVANTGLENGDEVNVKGNPLSYQSIYTHIPALQSKGVTVEFDNQAHPAILKISGDNQKGASFTSLSQPFVVEAQDANGSALVGVSVMFAVTAGGGTFSTTITRTDENGRAQSTLILGPNLGTNTVEISAAGIEAPVTFYAITDTFPTEYLWSIPAGISLIHVPLKVTSVDGVAKTITSIADLHDALGGADTVNFLIAYDYATQGWLSYFGSSDTGTSADKVLTDDIGIIAGMIVPVSIRLGGSPLGANGTSTITLNQGINLVGLPLRDSRITRVSDLFALDGIGDNVPVVILTDNGEFKAVGQAGDPSDLLITGGQAFILTAQRAETVTISGNGWYNTSAMAAASPIGNADLHSLLTGIQVTDTTPVLGLRGSIVDEETGLKVGGFRVTVKNLSTGREATAVTTPDGAGYRLTVVDIETGQAAQIGDILEVSAQSPYSSIGVQPLRYTVTAEDVLHSRIQLVELVAYKIPAETELLSNYPNPFNPETWIPYRLAEDAFVTLIIYDTVGQVVRTLDVGHRIASAYESRSKAIYWDGRNDLGEQVASGIYFYTLTAGDFSATRRMVIVK